MPTRKLRFGEHTVDLTSGTVTRRGAPVPLQEQPRRLLLLLLTRANTVVTRDDIRAELWPDTVVEFDQSINYAIRHIRAALGADGNLIQTVPRHGYRLAGPIRPHADVPRPVAFAAALATLLFVTFAAGIVASRTDAGQFIYVHLVHPDRCPYIRMLLPIRGNS